jgi:3-oxoacyl-[acyl-carrier-protein] synthase-1
MGAVCSAGIGVDAAYAAVASGRDLLSPLSVFASGLKEEPLCAQVTDDLEETSGARAPNRTLACALLAADEAVAQLPPDRHGRTLGVVVATTVAGMARSERYYRDLLNDESCLRRAMEELRYHEPTTVTAGVVRRVNAHFGLTVSTACSAGLHAIGMARHLIERGRCDLCLALGADTLSLLTVRGFASLVLLDPQGCRPFDRTRAGISLGEGAGAILLASPSSAKALGMEHAAVVSGWGASSDCHHMTAPHPEGEGAALAVRAALADAGLDPSDIDWVAAHGTGTPDNDVSEIRALRSVLGKLPPFCSMKRTVGHMLGASGAIEGVLSVKALLNNAVPPTGGFATVDEAIGAAPSSYAGPMRHVLKNAFGFGGNNCTIVFSKAPS